MDTELGGRVALITGAGRGIGAAIARALAGEGVAIGVNDVDVQAAEWTASSIRKGGVPAVALACDVTRADDVAKMMSQCVATLGRLDVLVNNAGIGERCAFAEMDEEAWDRVLRINLKSVYLCSREALPRLTKRTGRIISIASVWATAPAPQLAHYAASKAGVVAVTKALAAECAGDGITVNAVAPGHVKTDMTAAMSADALRRVRESILLPHGLGEPSDIADAVVFLASARARHITGETLSVNGGQWMS